MRKALNENPAVQAGVVVVLLVVFAFILFTRVLGGEEAPPVEDTAQPAAAVDGTAALADSASVPAATAPDPLAEAAAAGEFVAGPGLPQKLVSAYADGKAVVLLITRGKGIDDRRLAEEVGALRSREDVAVFTTHAKGIARYSRVTSGVQVDRTPALVVLRPRKASAGGPPLASVSYGFRGPQSVEQAVRDALYQGREDLPYYPE